MVDLLFILFEALYYQYLSATTVRDTEGECRGRVVMGFCGSGKCETIQCAVDPAFGLSFIRVVNID